jgi:serine beta-lactamase-like protein LACTB
VTEHLAYTALRQMLAVKQNKPLPTIDETIALEPGVARRLAGRWQSGENTLDLDELGGRLWEWPGRGGARVELRRLGDTLLADDPLARGLKVEPAGESLKIGVDTYRRIPEEKPAEAPAKWRGLIGEYGWDYQTLYVLERNGKLHALAEWFYLYPLGEESADVYRFPDHGVFAGEKLTFARDPSGRATRADLSGIAFERRKIDGENGETFRIQAQRPLAELRRESRAAVPPKEEGDFRTPDLVELTALEPGIKLDIRYATENNFLSTPFYTSAKAFMQRPAAEAVARVHRGLAAKGYGLLVFDGYRPWSVTKMFWDATPERQRIFVADPSKGSRHNRGCAVDLTLYDLKTGKPIEMVGGYDEFSDRSYPQYPGGTSLQRWHRELLRHAMEGEGFTVYEAEWWHFDYKDWRRYPILNKTFEELAAAKP